MIGASQRGGGRRTAGPQCRERPAARCPLARRAPGVRASAEAGQCLWCRRHRRWRFPPRCLRRDASPAARPRWLSARADRRASTGRACASACSTRTG